MTRIIAGTAGGRRIMAPHGRTTRPMGDRAREALFASVLSELGSFEGVRVLDLYAGSGAMGLEALSRGATHALLVETDRRAASVVRRNIATLGLSGAVFVADRVQRVVERGPEGAPYDLVISCPPYPLPDSEVTDNLVALRDRGWLADEALIVVERASRGDDLRWPEGYVGTRARRYGDATLWYGRAASLSEGS